jgi:broad specificity phosphatase PhoE
MKVYFVRHGESVFNARRIHQHGEVELSEQGREQASFVAKRFKSIDFEIIISSDYERAKTTARIIGQETGKEVLLTELARERKLPSVFHGRAVDDPELEPDKELIVRNIRDPKFRHSDEETFYELRDRAIRFIKYLEGREEQNLLVVLHGTILRYILSAMAFGNDFDWDAYISFASFLRLDNTGITVCEKSDPDRWQMITWTDNAHLGEV